MEGDAQRGTDQGEKEVIDAFETKSDPGALWAKWIDVLVARRKIMADGPER
jgi:hypothetical protein